jgi:hypothetical protein
MHYVRGKVQDVRNRFLQLTVATLRRPIMRYDNRPVSGQPAGLQAIVIRVTLLVILPLSSGCDQPPANSAAVNTTPVAARRTNSEPGHIDTDDFRRLNWVLGSWQGTTPEGTVYFESYRVLNDSAIQMYLHANSASGPQVDSARIYLSDGRIYTDSRAGRWVASGVADSGILFLPLPAGRFAPATRRIRWTLTDSLAWRIDAEDAGINRTYTMQRLSKGTWVP